MGRIFRPTSIVRDANNNPVLDEHGNPKRKPRTDNWYIRYYDANGKPHDESTHSTKIGDAKRLLHAREAAKDRGERVGAKVGKVTFDEAATDIVNDYKTNGRRTLAHLKRRIEKHLKPVFGGRRMANITTADVRAFIAARLEAGASKAEINRELAALKRMFTLAVQAGKLLHRPHIPMLKERNARQGFFEREQFEAVRAHLPAYLRPLATFCYWTGWRRDEVIGLETRQVDLKASVVRLEPDTTKNDDGRQFHFSVLDELRDMLTEQLASAERLSREQGRIVTIVFHREDGSRIVLNRFYREWKAACIAAGYPGRIPHDFRRTAVRNLERASVPRSTSMAMVGHKTESIYRRYAIVDEQSHREAAEKLSVFATGKAAEKKPAKVQQFKR